MTLLRGLRYSLLVGQFAAGGGGGGGGGDFPLDDIVDVTGAWSFSRDLLTVFIGGTRYTDSAGAIITLEDQVGNGRDFTDSGNSNFRPTLINAGPNSRAAASFNGVDNFLRSVVISNFITNTTGYAIISAMADSIATNDATIGNNDAFFTDTNNVIAFHLKSVPTAHGMHHDGIKDVTTHSISTGVPLVCEWWHESGTLHSRVNGADEQTATSGNSLAVNGSLDIGRSITPFTECTIFEMAIASAIPTEGQRDALVADWMSHVGA